MLSSICSPSVGNLGGMMVIAAGDPLKGNPCSGYEWVEDRTLDDFQDSDGDEAQTANDGAMQGRFSSLLRRGGGCVSTLQGEVVLYATTAG